MPKKSQKILLLIAAVLAVSWVLWVTIGGNTGVSQKIISYNVVDDTMTTVDLAVTKDPEDTAECALKAMNDAYAVVGWNVITIGPNSKDAGSENGHWLLSAASFERIHLPSPEWLNTAGS